MVPEDTGQVTRGRSRTEAQERNSQRADQVGREGSWRPVHSLHAEVMSTSHFTHFVFVDFENVPNIELGRVAGKPVHVSLLLGKNQRNLDVGLVQSIHRLAAQVQLVEVGASG